MSDCNSTNTNDGCECCPVGYVGIYEACGKFAGCVTPNEAKDYNNAKKSCAEGYVLIENPVTGDAVGCVLPADAPALIAALTPTITLNVSTTNVKCNGDSDGTCNVQIIGGLAPFVVSYDGGADPAALAAGSYVVTVTDANSESSAYAFTIVEPNALSLVVTTTPESAPAAADGTAYATVSGGVTDYTYDWTLLGAPIGDTRYIKCLVAGTYSVTVTDRNGCVVTDAAVIVS